MSRRWWEQAGLDLEGEKKRGAAAAAEWGGGYLIGEEEGMPLESYMGITG